MLTFNLKVMKLYSPYYIYAKVQGDQENPVTVIHTREGTLRNDHTNQYKYKGVGQVTEHAPKPKLMVERGKNNNNKVALTISFSGNIYTFCLLAITLDSSPESKDFHLK